MSTGGLTSAKHTARELAIGKLWAEIVDNFHKYSEPNKIKLMAEILGMDVPQHTTIDGIYNVTKMPTVKINDKEQELPFGRSSVATPSAN
jgi:hypothetical protein